MNAKLTINHLTLSIMIHACGMIIIIALNTHSTTLHHPIIIQGRNCSTTLETFYKPIPHIEEYRPPSRRIQKQATNPQSLSTDLNITHPPHPHTPLSESQQPSSIDQIKTDQAQPATSHELPQSDHHNNQPSITDNTTTSPKPSPESSAPQTLPSPSQQQRHQPLSQAMKILYQSYAEQAVRSRWNPPIGVPPGTECLVQLSISCQGVVEQATIKKPSGILIYDLSIQQVMHHFKFHRLLWGKRFTINFRL